MKRSIYPAAMAFLLVFVWSVSSWAEEKTGFINVNEIIQTSKTGQKKLGELKKYMDKKQNEIKTMESDLTAMKDELEKNSSVMTETKKLEKELAYQKKLRAYQILVNDTNEELKRRDQDAIQMMVPEVLKIVRKIAEKEKYSMVIDLSTTQLPFYAPEKDFSKKVIEEYDKAN
jgi:outer membrane protein